MTWVTRFRSRPRSVNRPSCDCHGFEPWYPPEVLGGGRVPGRQHHGLLGTVTADEPVRRAAVDDPPALDDRHPVAQALGLFHQVRRQEHGLPAVADAAHHLPDHAACLRIEAGGQFVEQHHVRVVDEGQRDEQPLLLTAGQRHEPGVPLVGQPEAIEERLAVDGVGIERRPEVDRLPHLDALLELRLLELDPDPLLQLTGVPDRIERQHRDGAAVGRAEALDALHRGRLAGAVGADEPEDLALENLEAHVVDGDRLAVGLADAVDLDDGSGGRHAA